MSKLLEDGLEIMKLLAQSRRGECLSTKYTGRMVNYTWKCCAGHVWEASYCNVKRGTWCSECSSGKSERICRAIFEQLFASKFPKKRPDWLKTKRGTRLELDGYNEKLAIAFEYNGLQHYKPEALRNDNLESFQYRVECDSLKKLLCDQRGIHLIVIPTLAHMLDVTELPKYIIDECNSREISLSMSDVSKIDLSTVYERKHHSLDAAISIIEARSGTLEKSWPIRAKLSVKCEKGHEWNTHIYNVLRGQWCRKCSGYAKKSLVDLQLYAKSRGGECLATEYKKGNIPVKWRCDKGHEWYSKPCAIIPRKSWCAVCSGNRPKDLAWLKTLAENRNGVCLATSYTNAATKVVWNCDKSHEWLSTGTNIASGSWCPHCALTNKIERFKNCHKNV